MILAILSLDLGGENVLVGHFTPSTDHLHTQGSLSFLGRHSADTSLWSAIATMLATLDFNLAKDVDGNDVTFKPTFTGGLSRYVQIIAVRLSNPFLNDSSQPNPFPCRLTPRAHINKDVLDRVLSM